MHDGTSGRSPAVGSGRKVTGQTWRVTSWGRSEAASHRIHLDPHKTRTKQPWKKIRPGVVSETALDWSEHWLIQALQTCRHDRTPTATWPPKLTKTTRPRRRRPNRHHPPQQTPTLLPSRTHLDPRSRVRRPRHVPRAASAHNPPLSKLSTTRWARLVPWAMCLPSLLLSKNVLHRRKRS